MLMAIRSYVQQHGRASLSDIALHVRRDPEAVRGMLAHWVGKGMMQRHVGAPACAKASGCGGCACDPAQFESYEWTGSTP
ncbi:FeoC-like transcriptional regulator [Paracoccaceae bacterium Fryx2]|nr:FeoC-like transcriptional regulator [Paracoccaceae bacterium Fryx2]